MRAVFLGTGTSHGIPVIGCDCAVCRSPDPRNRRLRSSLWLRRESGALLIDTSPDLRRQALRFGVDRVDAVFYTHAHADHIFGFDDLRRYCRRREEPLPIWADAATCRRLADMFDYARQPPQSGTTRPSIRLNTLREVQRVAGFSVRPLPVSHGVAGAVGYLVETGGKSLAYIPDCSGIGPAAAKNIEGCDVLILDTLRERPHPTHFNIEQSLQVFRQVKPGRGFVTHMCHELEHSDLQKRLPPGIFVPYDGMSLEV